MKKLNYLIASFALFLSPFALAQNSSSPNPADPSNTSNPLEFGTENTPMTPEEIEEARKAAEEAAEEAAGVCAACGGGLIIFAIILIALNIALLVWVARDAKSRGMDNAVLWLLLVFFLGPIGFIIYILSRTKGDLVQCSSCQGKRLTASATCPHCQNP